MSTEIILQPRLEEEELTKKREELVHLQADLAERELFLTNLRAELAAFQRRYLREVGVLYAELDDWSAKIAEWLSKHEQHGFDDIDDWDAKIAELAGEERSADAGPGRTAGPDAVGGLVPQSCWAGGRSRAAGSCRHPYEARGSHRGRRGAGEARSNWQ